MAEDIARLGLELDSRDIKKGTKDLDRLEKQAGQTEGKAKKLTQSFSGLGAAIGAIGIGLVATKIISVNAEFSKLNGALETVTGSADAASDVVERMKILMNDVPGSLNDLTQSFIKLTALGLDPSEKAIIAYSNVAAAMGKDLNQMIEAVADAATGEFERLKEFGIKAASEGDRVKFTFQGITKEVGKNSEEIQDYLLAIGETQFAGAAAKQMNTFGGALDNVGSQLEALLIDEKGLPGATTALRELGDAIADPAMSEGMDSLISGVATIVKLSAEGAAAFASFAKELGNVAAFTIYGDIEKEATQAINLTNEQIKKVRLLNQSIADGKKNLPLLRETAGATSEQIEGLENLILTQETTLEREQRRLDVMQGINTATRENIELEKEKVAIQAEAISIPELEGFDDDIEFFMARNDAERALQLEHEEEMQQIKEDSAKQQQQTAIKNSAFAIRLAESGNRSATELLRGYLLDQAKMLGQTAIVGAYKWGAAIGGPIAGAAAAGAASLAVGAIISGIQGGGGGGGSGAGGGSTVGEGGGIGPSPQGVAQPEAESSRQTTFKINAGPDELVTVGALFKMMNEGTDRGYKFETS